MATAANTTASPATSNQETSEQATRQSANATQFLMSGLRLLSSLKLTVMLFALGLIVIYAGTMAQYKMGIWDVVKTYFRSFAVWIPFDVFFPPHWFPSMQWVTGGIFFPGGKLIGIALLTNLTAAHLIRFKVTTSGRRLVYGSVVTGLGILLTSLIIVQGSVRNGVQDKPLLPMEYIWYALVAALCLLMVVMVSGLFLLARGKDIQRILLSLGIVGIGGLLTYLYISGSSLDNKALRILWQMIQATTAGSVMLAGLVIVFKKRAGIVLLHAGIALLMLNELYVGLVAVEERITLYENDVTNMARDIRTVEIAVTDRSDEEFDQIVTIPRNLLVNDSIVDHEQLPFRVRVEFFTRNSELTRKTSDSAQELVVNGSTKKLKATQGQGQFYNIKPLPPVPGAEAEKTDLASAYVSLLPKDQSKPIASFMLSQHLSEAQTTRPDDGSLSDSINFEGTKYEIALRYKRSYKPYKIKLLDVEKEDYVGTSTPRSYWSKFEVIEKELDADGNETGEEKILPSRIEMNNPLRFQGETFYQSGYQKVGTRELSTFQVVTNRGWMIPYVCCVIVALGMIAQFSTVLFKFLERFNRQISTAEESRSRRIEELASRSGRSLEPDRELVEPLNDSHNTLFQKAWPPLTALLITLVFLGYCARPKKSDNDMNLHKAGKIPMAYQGRVLPLDSFARNTLRRIYEKEEIYYQDDKKRSALQWFFDVATNSNDVNDARLFRVYNPDVKNILRLAPKRKRHYYSMTEIEENMDEFQKAVNEAAKIEKGTRRKYHDDILELARDLNDFRMVQRYFNLPPDPDEEPVVKEGEETRSYADRLMFFTASAIDVATSQSDIPLIVPTMRKDAEWETLTVTSARDALAKYAKEKNFKNPSELSVHVWNQMIRSEQEHFDRELSMAVLRDIRDGLREYNKQNNMNWTTKEISDKTLAFYRRPEARKTFESQLAPVVRQQIATQRMNMKKGFIMLNGGDEFASPNETSALLEDLLVAYKAQDDKLFNEITDKYLEFVKTIEPKGLNRSKIRAELTYHAVSPLWTSSVVYLFAALFAAMGWLFAPVQFRRLAFWMIVFAVGVHSIGLLTRIYVSGRPPVTNLYSSAVFIGWAAAVIGLIIERANSMGIGNIIGGVLGFVTLLIARYLALGEDTFKVVEAVLDTQFWLATHVVCITLGYATTFFAGFIGLMYVTLGVLTPKLDKPSRQAMARMIYGMTCFSILFSFVGTVLGGLWADDSWGRFWGWDPKENGAMLIVVWNALILHARWGGMIRERGLAVLAVFGNIVTAFSWFGVNQLGVGLHSYGFSNDILGYLKISVVFFLTFVVLGSLPTKIWWSLAAEEYASSNLESKGSA